MMMMNKYEAPAYYTEEQKEAVMKQGKNIIVSAGAGSGKTAVLKERVLRILMNDYFKDGRKVSISNLIILTFTKNSASEMKERIRKIINEHPEVSEEAKKLDSAYITTFDSFAQSIVKKYNYLLNMPANFSIIDDSVLDMEINKILDEIMEDKYEKREPEFTQLINVFCIKDDTPLRKSVINIYKSLQNNINMDDFLENYITDKYKDEYLHFLIDAYTEMIFKLRDDAAELLESLGEETEKEDKREANYISMANFLNATTYDELLTSLDIKLAMASKGVYTEEGKEIKTKTMEIITRIKKLVNIPSTYLLSQYKSTLPYAKTIIDIIKNLNEKVKNYKEVHNAYNFTDIAFKAIEIVKNNPDVCEEIKHNTYEIMIDEYQDTNDIQETFVSYIQNDNVYMVGDIKQSIYGFRNANPAIFKNKYDSYKDGIKGYKIDLTKNFRSRSEVVTEVNKFFDNIMTNDVGGANYKKEHQMVFGFKKYDEVKSTTQDYSTTYLNYQNTDYKDKYNTSEIEAFIIAKDINDKINSHTSVFDDGKLREITYKDFAILIDKGKNFETVKKILEYNHIPTQIHKDLSVKEDDEIFILKSLINLIIKVHEHAFFDNDYKHYFASVARSYIYKLSDDEIFDIIKNKTFNKTELYQKCLTISDQIDALSNKELLMKIIDDFDIINKLSLVGDIDERLSKLEYFINNAESLNNLGMNIYDMSNYFDELLESDEDLTMSASISSGNSVNLMTIHASKGLEFNYVYLPYLNSDFTKGGGSKSRFSYSSTYGLIIPFYKDGVGNTLLSSLKDNQEYLSTLSEKIRLLYVALTRAKENLIMINSFKEEYESINDISYSDMTNVKSYSDILELLRTKINITNVDLENVNLTTEYKAIRNYNYIDHIPKSNVEIKTKEVLIQNDIEEEKHFSKIMTKIKTKEMDEKLQFGTKMHYIFEIYNFNNSNLDDLKIDDIYKDRIKSFLNHKELQNINQAKVYKEHEFLYKEGNKEYHGIIDLLLEYKDHLDIIDYKTSDIDEKEYLDQLNGYKKYIENINNKKTNIYLYSINKDELRELN
jgi:ATP-dependent helicase/nuclease subunit A